VPIIGSSSRSREGGLATGGGVELTRDDALPGASDWYGVDVTIDGDDPGVWMAAAPDATSDGVEPGVRIGVATDARTDDRTDVAAGDALFEGASCATRASDTAPSADVSASRVASGCCPDAAFGDFVPSASPRPCAGRAEPSGSLGESSDIVHHKGNANRAAREPGP
jgi:hypothetical protein